MMGIYIYMLSVVLLFLYMYAFCSVRTLATLFDKVIIIFYILEHYFILLHLKRY